MDEQVKKLLEYVNKREREEWERCQVLHEKFGGDDTISKVATTRWYQWYDFQGLLTQLKEK